MFFSLAAEIGIWWRGGGDLVEPSLQPQLWSRAGGKQAEVSLRGGGRGPGRLCVGHAHKVGGHRTPPPPPADAVGEIVHSGYLSSPDPVTKELEWKWMWSWEGWRSWSGIQGPRHPRGHGLRPSPGVLGGQCPGEGHTEFVGGGSVDGRGGAGAGRHTGDPAPSLIPPFPISISGVDCSI